MPNVMTVFMGPRRDLGACEIYRSTAPLMALSGQNRSWDATWIFMEDLLKDYLKYGANAILRLIQTHKLWVFPRLIAPNQEARVYQASFFELLRRFDCRLVYEIDDDYTNQHRDVTGDGDAIWCARQMDAVTVTTPLLARVMEKAAGRKTYVLPNMIDPNVWGVPFNRSAQQDKVLIGLTGSPSHKQDWAVMETPIRRLLTEHPEARLIVCGHYPSYLDSIENVDYVPWVSYEKYPALIKSCDIIIAPVDPNDHFNDGKSPLKVVEGMAATRKLSDGSLGGAATIASNTPVYRLALNGANGLLAEHTENGWYSTLKSVLADPSLRLRLQKRGHKWVYQHLNVSTGCHLWGEAYSKILRSPPVPPAA